MIKEMPKHVALIMDGNGRWAKKRLLTKSMGHRAGGQALKKLIEKIDEAAEVKHLTVYAFSTENWKRSDEEVSALMGLLKEYIGEYIKDSKNNNLKIDCIGDISKLSDDLRADIEHLEEISRNKTGLNVHIALNYGSRDELTRAVRSICRQATQGKISADDVNEDTIEAFLDTAHCPDPELIIRTSGEKRLSNFLLWQAAYSEFYFTDKLWPDFTYKDFSKAIESYMKRDRRFGGRNEVE